MSARARHAPLRLAPEGGEAINRRADLIRVAAQLFRERGFEGTTIRDIAAAVGMRSGSPFYHFANKHELLMAVMEAGLRLGLARSEEALRDAQATAKERFRRLVRAQFGILHDDGSDFVPVMLYEWRSLPEPYRRRLIVVKDEYDQIWQRTLDELHAQGLLRAEPHLARLMILGAINFSATWHDPTADAAHHVDLDQLTEQTLALVLHDA